MIVSFFLFKSFVKNIVFYFEKPFRKSFSLCFFSRFKFIFFFVNKKYNIFKSFSSFFQIKKFIYAKEMKTTFTFEVIKIFLLVIFFLFFLSLQSFYFSEHNFNIFFFFTSAYIVQTIRIFLLYLTLDSQFKNLVWSFLIFKGFLLTYVYKIFTNFFFNLLFKNDSSSYQLMYDNFYPFPDIITKEDYLVFLNFLKTEIAMEAQATKNIFVALKSKEVVLK